MYRHFQEFCHMNIYLDKEFQFIITLKSSSTIEDLKNSILMKLNLYSINYILEYNERNYSKFDNFKLSEIFLIQRDEYDIFLTKVSTIKNEKTSRVIMTYEEGGSVIIIYNIITGKFQKMVPEMSKYLSFAQKGTFPYNSRYCNIQSENRLIIAGGLGFETGCCSYDLDINYLDDLPEMKVKRQRQGMINIGEKAFVIGGDACKNVSCLNIKYESWEEYPDMNIDRKDPSVLIANEKYLYVFMGYSSEISDTAQNYERLDISVDAYCDTWKLLPMYNTFDYKIPKTFSGVTFHMGQVLFLGGLWKCTVDNTVLCFNLNDNSFSNSSFKLPFVTSFTETTFFSPTDENDCYQFTYATQKLINFNKKTNNLIEIPWE